MTGRIVTGEEAKALREGALSITAPYPWTAVENDPGDVVVVTGKHGSGPYVGGCPDCGTRAGFEAEEAALIAAAPDLAFTVEQHAASLAEVRRRLTDSQWSASPEDRIRVALLHIDAALAGTARALGATS